MSNLEISNTSLDRPDWDIVIRPSDKWINLPIKDVWEYRDLMWLFVRRDFVAQYKQTVLGPAWHFIQPVLTTAMFLMVFNKIARIPTDGIAPGGFYMAGLTIWSYFSNALTSTSNTFVHNASIFGKVYFPRLVLPISVVISSVVKFGIQFLLLLVLLAYYHFNGYPVHLGPQLLAIPFLLVQMAALSLGLGIIISSATTKYRDFSVLLGFAVQLLMYATPVVYPLSYVQEKSFKWLVMANPLTSVVESFRWAIFGIGTVDLLSIMYSIGFTIITLVVGVLLFNRVEKTFMDTV
ncbi:ABC transporter permease [Paraflavisolibacter sp. H34]|uniref:ABC transporter permease n=1 Tax=Huijunlia imazamoxiresistens TaxID=3127457 RepID=UPI003017BAEE